MENASKALLMTGSILIGIILLSLAVYLYGVMSDAKKIESSSLTEEQIVAYNMEWLSYYKGAMYGTDVISMLNKAISLNRNFDNDYDKIDIKFKLRTSIEMTDEKGNTYKLNGNDNIDKATTYSLLEDGELIAEFLNSKTTGFTDLKRKIFKCTSVGYNESGKVNLMTFEEVKQE